MKKDPWRGVSRVFFVREGFPASTHRLKEAGVLSIVINNALTCPGVLRVCTSLARSYLFVQQEIPCHAKKGFPDIPESLMV